MPFFKILFFILICTSVYSKDIQITQNTKFLDLLPLSEVYIDKSKTLTVNDIKNVQFKENNKKTLSFGYSPKFNVWIKFTLKNNTDKPIKKIIEYENSLTTNINFYDPNKNYKSQKEGLFHINKQRKSLNPIYHISLNPYSTETFYIKTSSYITTLILKLNIWNNKDFYEKEIRHQMILSLFFGAMSILGLYNLFIFFFTKDKSYLFYVMYILGIILHQLVYVGFGSVHLFNQDTIVLIIKNATLLVAFPIFSLALFTKYFLQLKNAPKLNFILNIFLVLMPITVLTFMLTDELNRYRNLISIILLSYLIILTIYFVIKKNRQAYFILFGWLIIFISVLFMFFSSIGIFNIFDYFNYLIEISLVSEAIIFSIALADRINSLQKEKDEANYKLLMQQQNETERLTNKVNERTKDLKEALNEKSLLLKELNHRVKNNMQTIVSLIRLQSDDIEDSRVKNVLLTIQNRINAMSHLHELLYKQENVSHINTYEYFEILVEEVKDSYENHINIHLNIKVDLKVEHAIYCGLILNELLTNSYKYAFPDKKGDISIHLEKTGNDIHLFVKDTGIGYDKMNSNNSLGLILVETLAKHQLKGEIITKSNNGVQTLITWKENEDENTYS